MTAPKTLTFEAVKVSMRQTKDGTIIAFVLHPDDVLPELMTDPIGTRYQLVAVKLDEERGQPAPPKPEQSKEQGTSLAKAQQNVVTSAGILCRDRMFRLWFAIKLGQRGREITEVEAAEELCRVCGITTRASLKVNEAARERFFALRSEFLSWRDQSYPAEAFGGSKGV